jgi:septum formation protein
VIPRGRGGVAGRVILASASPRRRELLRFVCPDFDVLPSGVDETLEEAPSATAAAALALRKARAVAARARSGIVLAADTLVVVDGIALGKPAGAEDAHDMLRRLSGRPHRVITGVAVVEGESRREQSEAAVSQVFMRELRAEEIDAYVASGEPYDKAGAYAIQGLGGRLVAALLGSYTNVVGFPLPAVRRLLASFGFPEARERLSGLSRGRGAAAPGEAYPRGAGA